MKKITMNKASKKGATNKTRLPPLASKGKAAASSQGIFGSVTNNNKISVVKQTSSLPTSDIERKTKPPTKLEGLQKTANLKTQKLPQKQKALPSIKNAEKEFDELLEGRLDSIPPIPSSNVRIFISSTFADMKEERNWLAKIAYPQLKDMCAELDLDFQVIDMRWGILDTMTNDHQTEKLCLQEIANCQRISLGPNFVSILGDRYGYRPIPTEIAEEEFNILCQEARTEDKNWPIKLQEWYFKDENIVPPEYILQPITMKFKYFGDYTNEERRKKDSDDWWAEFNLLQQILRTASANAAEKGLMTSQQLHEYVKSVTECEIEAGILNVNHPQQHALGYMRRFQGLVDDRLGDDAATRHVDIVTNQGKAKLDTEVAKLRQSLFADKVKMTLNDNTRKYYVTWQNGGIDPLQHEEHKQYIELFSVNFVKDTMKLIVAAHQSKSQLIRRSEYYSDYAEILHHLNFCRKKCETFCGQDEILGDVREYLNEKHRMPLVIHAESGVGKTSVLAKITSMLRDWFGPECIRIVRFLGTSPKSSNIFDVLLSVCGQLADICEKIMEPEGYRNMNNLMIYFPRFLRNVSRDLHNKQVFILLDSLDQLYPAHNAHAMNWVITSLPANIHLIISTLPKEHGCLDNLRKILPNVECYKELKPVPVTTGQEILSSHIRNHKRIVSEIQQQFLNSILKHNPTPLFLKLVADQAALWKSYTPAEDLILASTAKKAIAHLFQTMEIKFGQLLVEKSLGYLTCGLNGLSEVELEDALSCSNEVLIDVYQYHDPPEENNIRIPSLLWARIHYDISEYLIERQSQGKTTHYWYHRQFIEVATERYVTTNKNQIHKELADLYMASKPVKKTIELSKRNITMKNVDRRVTLQPVIFKNVRRLECLMHHLKHAGDTERFKRETICNLQYLMMKAQAFSFQYLINEIESLVEELPDEEIKVLHSVLGNASVKANSQLPVQLLARLDHEAKGTPNLTSLLHQAQKYAKSSETALLVPLFDCFNTKKQMENEDFSVTSCDTNYSNQFVVTNSGDSFIIWDLTSWRKHYAGASIAMTVNEIKLAADDTILLGWEKASGKLQAWNFTTGQQRDTQLGDKVSAFVLTNDKQKCYIVRRQEQGIQVELWDMKEMVNIKTYPVKKFSYTDFSLLLTANEQYLVFLIECDENAQQEITAFGKKELGGYKPHVGNLRFAAVSLTKDSPNIVHCYRPLSKVPFLGNSAVAVDGSVILIGLQITATFWNLDSGKCDGLTVKGERGMGQFFRPHWTQPKESAHGRTTGFMKSADNKLAITGSEDGWAIVYELQTGLALGSYDLKASFQHKTPVTCVTISDNGQWAASASEDGQLKLWKVVQGKGAEEAFNIQMELRLTTLHFSANGDFLIAIGNIQDGEEFKPLFCAFSVSHGKP